MKSDTQAELTIVSGGKSYKMMPLTFREYSAFLRKNDSFDKLYDLMDHCGDFIKTKMIGNSDCVELMEWPELNALVGDYCKACTVSPEDKKKSE